MEYYIWVSRNKPQSRKMKSMYSTIPLNSINCIQSHQIFDKNYKSLEILLVILDRMKRRRNKASHATFSLRRYLYNAVQNKAIRTVDDSEEQ